MQRARVSNHPCHRLSVPAAKRFWCRHCMMVFEDAITRWRHSRSCRSGGFDNFVRRREIETQALQKMAETLDPEMVTQVAVPSGEGGAGGSKELCCFICKQRFLSLDEMREHVKYPCNKPTPVQRPSMTVYIEEPTFGTGIQHHYTDNTAVSQTQCHQEHSTAPAVPVSSDSPHPVTVYMNESEQGHQDSEAKPTNIYVNEKGETVIEVENLDLNTTSGELSLAHLLTQLSQQGIVFDQQAQGETEISTSHQESQLVQDAVQEADYSQPTAVDAANTLTQLAGSAFRAANNFPESYTYAPAMKRIKTEGVEIQYPLETQEQVQVQTYLQKHEPAEESEQEKYIICTNESEVISVVRADGVSPENSSSEVVYQNGPFSSVNEQSGPSQVQTTSGEDSAEERVMFQGSQAVTVHSTENETTEANFTDSSVIMLQDQSQVHAAPLGQLIKNEASEQLVITHNVSEVGQTGELAVAVIGGVDVSQEPAESKSCLVMPAGSQESTATFMAEAAVTGLLGDSEESATVKNAQITEEEAVAESALLLPQIVSVTSTSASDAPLVLQHKTGLLEENCMIKTTVTDDSASSVKCNKVFLSCSSENKQKGFHERIVTRSMSVSLQNQKTRVLRSQTLPLFPGPLSQRRKIRGINTLKNPIRPSLSLPSRDNFPMVKEGRKRCSVTTCHRPSELHTEKTISNKIKRVVKANKECSQSTPLFKTQMSDCKILESVEHLSAEQQRYSTMTAKVPSKCKQCKCIICGSLFNSARLLQRHRRVPCRVKHTRNMSQKVLRPRMLCSAPVKVRHRKVSSQEKRRSKPRLLFSSLLLHPHISHIKTCSKKPKDFQASVLPPPPPPQEPEICLKGKRLVVSSLTRKEQHMATLGLVSTAHITAAALMRHQAVLRCKVATIKEQQQEAIALQICQYNNSNEIDCHYSSPPVLERIDLSLNFDQCIMHSEPPKLEPMVFLDNLETKCSENSALNQQVSKKDAVIVNSNNGSAFCTVQVAQSIQQPAKSFARITIKSLTSGLQLFQGGEIIIKTSSNKDRVLLINPDSNGLSGTGLNKLNGHAYHHFSEEFEWHQYTNCESTEEEDRVHDEQLILSV